MSMQFVDIEEQHTAGNGSTTPHMNIMNVGPLSTLSNLHGSNLSSILPGPFVVLQGSPGDGMANTIDSMPVLPPSSLIAPSTSAAVAVSAVGSPSNISGGNIASSAMSSSATAGAGGGGGTSSRRNSVEDRIPTRVLEELDSEVTAESAEDEEKEGAAEDQEKDVDQVNELPKIDELLHQSSSPQLIATSLSSPTILSSSPVRGSSNSSVNPRQRPRSNSDTTSSTTEGGLHLPLGSCASPIMRTAMHNFMSSPLKAGGSRDQLEELLREQTELVAGIQPLPLNDEVDGDAGENGARSGDGNNEGNCSSGMFLKRRSKSGEELTSRNNSPGKKRRSIKEEEEEEDDRKPAAQGESISTDNSPASSPSGQHQRGKGSSQGLQHQRQQQQSQDEEKSPAEIQAISKWHTEIAQQSHSHLTESNENVKLLIQRRKRTRDREAQRNQLRLGVSSTGSSSVRSLSPVGTATSASSSSSSSSGSSSSSADSTVSSQHGSSTQATSSTHGASTSSAVGTASKAKGKQKADEQEEQQEEEEEQDPLNRILNALELANKHRSWYQSNGRLVIFKSLPHLDLGGNVVVKPLTNRGSRAAEREVMTLSPGTTVMADQAYVLDSRTLRQVYPTKKTRRAKKESNSLKADGDRPQLTFLKITSPHTGYILSNVHSYPLLLPGLPTTYTNIHYWLWRVTCQPDGAYIRKGLELVTEHIGTLPYGTVCNVTKKIVNGMGLNRLQVEAHLQLDGDTDEKKSANGSANGEEESDAFGMKKYSGYISEFLNPLSGQRGNVVEPLPFPVPALYKVIHPKGCVIRSGVELSTAKIGFAPQGTVLSIVGRSYSDHPGHNCIERLKLAGGGGWISVTLNKRPPDNETLVQMVGVDGTFDPEDPAKFHFDSMRKVMEELHANNGGSGGGGGNGNGASPGAGAGGGRSYETRTNFRRLSSYANLSEIGEDDEMDQLSASAAVQDDSMGGNLSLGMSPTVPTLFRSGVVGGMGGGAGASTAQANTMDAIRESSSVNHQQHSNPNRCLICLSDERTATIVHGETGHIACCLTCARILKARGDNCPVCRLPIDLVIQQFWA